MEEKKKQAGESGSLYMTGRRWMFPLYQEQRAVSYDPVGNLFPTTECSVSTLKTKV